MHGIGRAGAGLGLAVSLVLACGAAAPALAQQGGGSPLERLARPSVVVTATGTVEAQPDQATLLLAVETVASDAQDAANRNAEKMQHIMDALHRAGVAADHIRTIDYHLEPQYRQPPSMPNATPEQQQPKIVGYRASNMVQVTLDDVARVGAAIDAGIGAGANRVANLDFGLKDPSRAHIEALRRAMVSARAQAEALAAAAGHTLGDPIQISMAGVGPGPVYAARMEAAAPTPIQPGTTRVSATVVARFALGPAR